MLKILKVKKNKTGWDLGLKKGDKVISINNNAVNDLLDYKFYICEELVNLHILRNGSEFNIEIEKEPNDELDIITESFRLKRCRHKCIFCFIDQNPPGMRKSIYIKDEDYRHSFLYGNYITMNNLDKNDIERIIEQRLSPLFVSVHAVDKNIRNFLLGNNENENIIDKIRILTDEGIVLHGQIVLCPKINDGITLKNTIFELFKYYPNFKSVSVIPVGLTKHRSFLYTINKVSKNFAKIIIREIEGYQEFFKSKTNENFVYLGDEFYIKANIPLPPEEYYDHFYQIENGVGLTRKFISDFKNQAKLFPQKIKDIKKIYLITGALAFKIIKKEVLSELKKVKNLEISLIKVENDFFGKTVTISGLLTGQEIGKAIKKAEPEGLVILPSNCVNEDGLFLDNWSMKDLKEYTSCEIEINHENFFNELFAKLV